jgi:hypothetical protein
VALGIALLTNVHGVDQAASTDRHRRRLALRLALRLVLSGVPAARSKEKTT